MNKLILSLSIASLLSVSAYAISAKEKHYADNERTLMTSLLLTQQQEEDIKQIKKDTQQDLSLYRVEQKQLRENMRTVMTAKVWDETAVTNAVEQQMTLSLQSKLIRAKSKNRVFNQLSTEQQAQFIAYTAGKKGNKKHKRASMKMRGLTEALNLSTEQQAQLALVMKKNKEQRIANKSQLKLLRRQDGEANNSSAQMAQIIQAKEFNTEAWLAVHAKSKQHKIERAVNRAKSRFDIMSILNGEQRDKFEKMTHKSKPDRIHKQHRDRNGERNNRHTSSAI